MEPPAECKTHVQSGLGSGSDIRKGRRGYQRRIGGKVCIYDGDLIVGFNKVVTARLIVDANGCFALE